MIPAPETTEALALQEIRRVLARELRAPRDVEPGDRLAADLGLDSLTLLTLVVALEDRFRVALKEEDAPGIQTVGELAALVARRVSEQGGGAHARSGT